MIEVDFLHWLVLITSEIDSDGKILIKQNNVVFGNDIHPPLPALRVTTVPIEVSILLSDVSSTPDAA